MTTRRSRRHVHEWRARPDNVVACATCPVSVLRCTNAVCDDQMVGESPARCPKCGATAVEDAS